MKQHWKFKIDWPETGRNNDGSKGERVLRGRRLIKTKNERVHWIL